MKTFKARIDAPSREDAERMLKIAYYIDKKFLRPIDMVDFGIDVYRLKECGEVRMSKSRSKVKPHVLELWGRMTKPMKAMFMWSHFCECVDELRKVHQELQALGEPVQNQRLELDVAIARTSAMLPAELQAKIKEGFGKEWRR